MANVLGEVKRQWNMSSARQIRQVADPEQAIFKPKSSSEM